MLSSGGNAVDAAIAAALMSCVAEPVLASPGGGGFALVSAGDRAPALYDFFAQTPSRPNPDALGFVEAVADFGPARQLFHIGPAAAATPGFIPGMIALHAAYASMPLGDLAAPAIVAAREGVTVTAFQAHLAEVVAPILLATPASRALFAPGGRLPAAGAMLSNPGMADLFADLAAGGQDAYAEAVVPLLLAGQEGGHLRGPDFESYRVERREPLRFRLGAADVFSNPAPAAGGILVAHTLRGLRGDTPVHHAKALQATDAARRKAGSDLSSLIEALGPVMPRGTTHISVADADGGSVALTLTNGEGNGEMVGRFGFMLNNMLGEEDVNPRGGTGWPTGVRLASMMAPTLAVFADGGRIVLGSGGSNRIRSAIAQVLAHAVLAGKPIEEAVRAPRLHVEAGHLDIEAGFAAADEKALRETFPNHRAWPGASMFFGGCHAVMKRSDRSFAAAGDARRAGAGLVL